MSLLQAHRDLGFVAPVIHIFELTPFPKPRMTQRDKWKKRPCVVRYRAFCDELRAQAERAGFVCPDHDVHLIFHLPMPGSWSGKKKLAMVGQPHQQKPDVDNLAKGFMDALLKDDSGVWDLRASKLWSATPGITVRRIRE